VKFKQQKRAGKIYVRGVVTVAEWEEGQLALMAPDKKTLRRLWNHMWAHKPIDMTKVKPYRVMRDERAKK
jgi:hypothetical protein